jgi:hypothetical protein
MYILLFAWMDTDQPYYEKINNLGNSKTREGGRI